MERTRNGAGTFELAAERQQELPEVARQVRELRAKAGLSQRELADLAGVSADSVTHVECGNAGSHATTPGKLLEVLEGMKCRQPFNGRYPDGRLSKSLVKKKLAVCNTTLWRWQDEEKGGCPYLDGKTWLPIQKKNLSHTAGKTPTTKRPPRRFRPGRRC